MNIEDYRNCSVPVGYRVKFHREIIKENDLVYNQDINGFSKIHKDCLDKRVDAFFIVTPIVFIQSRNEYIRIPLYFRKLNDQEKVKETDYYYNHNYFGFLRVNKNHLKLKQENDYNSFVFIRYIEYDYSSHNEVLFRISVPNGYTRVYRKSELNSTSVFFTLDCPRELKPVTSFDLDEGFMFYEKTKVYLNQDLYHPANFVYNTDKIIRKGDMFWDDLNKKWELYKDKDFGGYEKKQCNHITPLPEPRSPISFTNEELIGITVCGMPNNCIKLDIGEILVVGDLCFCTLTKRYIPIKEEDVGRPIKSKGFIRVSNILDHLGNKKQIEIPFNYKKAKVGDTVKENDMFCFLDSESYHYFPTECLGLTTKESSKKLYTHITLIEQPKFNNLREHFDFNFLVNHINRIVN